MNTLKVQEQLEYAIKEVYTNTLRIGNDVEKLDLNTEKPLKALIPSINKYIECLELYADEFRKAKDYIEKN